jgi:hypothetical protein
MPPNTTYSGWGGQLHSPVLFFAEHIDPSCGAVVADQQFLANQLDVSTRTIRNWLNYLEEKKALIRIPVAGKV